MSDDGWRLVEQRVLCDAEHIRVLEELVQTPSRPDGRRWTRAARKPGVCIAPRLPDGAYVLILEERVPARRAFWQFPAGQVEGEDSPDKIAEAARRELREETGCEVTGELTNLGLFFTSPGFTDEHTHQFLATEVTWDRGRAAHDVYEAILDVRAFSAADIRRMVAENVVQDANTLSVVARLCATGWL